MNAETLSIKMKLDIGTVMNDVKKVKTQLTGMAQSVKQSIPKIGTESKKAKEALNGVTKASKDVTKALDGIGEEAKESLSTVSKQSSKVAQALASIGIAGKSASAGLNVDGLEGSIDNTISSAEGLSDTLGNIQALSFTGLAASLAVLFNKPKQRAAELKEQIDGIKKRIEDFDFSSGNWDDFVGDIDTLTESTNEYTKATKSAKLASLGFKAALAALAVVIAGVVAAINAISVSKLGAEIYRGAQQAGMSAQAYQEWQYVLQRAGIEASELTEIMKTLTEAQVDVINQDEAFINAFKKLGMSAEEVMSMGQDALWDRTIAALQNVENATERTAIAYKIFGEDAAKLTTVLNLSNAETQKLISTYNQLGGAMSGELIHNSAVLQGSLANLRVAWQGLRNTLAQAVLPAVIAVVDWITKAIVVVNVFLQKFFKLDLTAATDSMTKGMTGTTSAIGGYTGAVEGATKAVEKLKRTTMGFDELNIVGNPNATSPDTSSGSGAGTGAGVGSVPINTGSSIFADASEQAEKFKKKVEDFIKKFEPQIKIIGAALAALGVAKLIEGLGNAIGLGDKFLGVMKNIKKVAGSAIVITLQYTMVNEFLDAYIDGEGFKNYIYGALTAALGTLILWSQWGTAGLAIGLGVTAVASLSAVFENGGITNVESAVTALTGLAAVIGTVIAAIAKFKGVSFGTIVKTALAAVTTAVNNFSIKIAVYLRTWWLALLPKITAALATAKGAIATALGVIKNAFVTVIKFVIANPIALVIAAIVAAVALIAVKGDEIQALLNKVSDWLKKTFVKDWRTVFGDTLGTIMNGAVKIIGDILGNVKKIMSGIIDFIRGVFTGDWRRAWNGIKDIFSGVFGGIKAVAKAPINAIITMINAMLSGIVKGFNAVKTALNKLSIKVPDWVPEFGGKTFGFNLKMSTAPKIPMLANGGIVTSDTIARLGERGKKEAVLPLEQNTGWMDALANKIAEKSGSDQPINVHLNVDGTELGWVAIRNINAITKQTGKVQLAW